MGWFTTMLLVFALTGITINIYILTYDIDAKRKWYYMLSAALGIFFNILQLYRAATNT
jgi:hypothetical protein